MIENKFMGSSMVTFSPIDAAALLWQSSLQSRPTECSKPHTRLEDVASATPCGAHRAATECDNRQPLMLPRADPVCADAVAAVPVETQASRPIRSRLFLLALVLPCIDARRLLDSTGAPPRFVL